ncbi:MAG: patatin-like phospholipase family protein [Acidobacteriota bacterium]
MSELETFLAGVSIFRDLTPEQLAEITPLFREEHHPAGAVILRQGGHSNAVYFVRSGRLAVRVSRPEGRETVAYLQPGAVFGELSFITGRTCSADVEVVVDADVVALPRDAIPRLPKHRETILRGMMTVLAERLHDTVTRGTRAAESPVILLGTHPNWEAPFSFAFELGRSLARQTGHETLVANLGTRQPVELRQIDPRISVCDWVAPGAIENVRAELANSLTSWKQRFTNVILNPVGPEASAICAQADAFADYHGELLGPGDKVPAEVAAKHFVVQSAKAPTLPILSGSQQLIAEAAESEKAFLEGHPVRPRFQRTVDSIARFIADLQVGLALGGGAAWGWAHIGILSVLEQAGLPIDVIAGCSMGTVVGTLRSSGRSVAELRQIADYWKTRTNRFIEPRVWRMHLLREKAVRAAFASYFGDRPVNQTEIPFWANAVDIKTGNEFTIKEGTLVEAVRASISLPGLLPPVSHGQHLLVDAGIIDPVPVSLVRRMGCRYSIAVNAMAPLEARDVSTRYPLNIFDVMFRCMRITGHEIGEARTEGAASVSLNPQVGDISMLAFDRAEEIIACGEKVAEENLPGILAGYESLKTPVSVQTNAAQMRF